MTRLRRFLFRRRRSSTFWLRLANKSQHTRRRANWANFRKTIIIGMKRNHRKRSGCTCLCPNVWHCCMFIWKAQERFSMSFAFLSLTLCRDRLCLMSSDGEREKVIDVSFFFFSHCLAHAKRDKVKDKSSERGIESNHSGICRRNLHRYARNVFIFSSWSSLCSDSIVHCSLSPKRDFEWMDRNLDCFLLRVSSRLSADLSKWAFSLLALLCIFSLMVCASINNANMPHCIKRLRNSERGFSGRMCSNETIIIIIK